MIRGEQVDDAAILAEDALNEQFQLLFKRRLQSLVEVREDNRIRRGASNTSQAQPFEGEIFCQGAGTRIGKQPFHLLFERARLSQSTLGGKIQEFFVGSLAPQKEREARSEFNVADW